MRRQQGADRRRTGRADRSERTAVFGKTKLCKFFILGVCSKGTECNFAHDAQELNQLPDLAKTKVCKALINTGHCDDPDCRYAHNRDELRDMPEVDPNLLRALPPSSPYQASPPNAMQMPQMNPHFDPQAFGQSAQGMPHDPQAQAAVLQQLAAQLSMQAAMIQAAHANGWPGQQPGGAQSSAQWLSPQQQLGASEAQYRQAVPVELAALTPQPNAPSFQKGRANDGGDAASSASGRNQRRLNAGNGRNKGFRPDGPRPGPPVGQSAPPYATGQSSPPFNPAKLPTEFNQEPSALQLGSPFHPPQASQVSNAWSSPMLGPTIQDPDEPSPRARLDSAMGEETWELSGMGDADDGLRRGSIESQGGEKRLQDTPVLGGMVVKHTFLDIQPEGPKAGMRSVQTHSGSLCLMTARDDDDDDE